VSARSDRIDVQVEADAAAAAGAGYLRVWEGHVSGELSGCPAMILTVLHDKLRALHEEV